MEIKIHVLFEVKINFWADGKPEIKTACFYWGGDGPHCFKVTDVGYGSPGTIKVKLTVTRPGSHLLLLHLYNPVSRYIPQIASSYSIPSTGWSGHPVYIPVHRRLCLEYLFRAYRG